jgi:hypothetical protein
MKTKRTWSTPSLSIYGKVEAVTTQLQTPRCVIQKQPGSGDVLAYPPVIPRGGGPPPGKCAGGNDVWTMWGHGQPHCGPALS